MRIAIIGSCCLLFAVSCGGDGDTSSDSSAGDVMDAGLQDQGPGTDQGNPKDPGPHPDLMLDDKFQPGDDGIQDIGSPDGLDDANDVLVACTEPGDCDDGNQCTADICEDGKCKNTCLAGLACDDGNPFSQTDKCILDPFAGKCLCVGVFECARDKDCNDFDPCTDDWCDENGECAHECQAGGSCDDADPKTINDKCLKDETGGCGCAGTTADCQEPTDCDDGNQCTADICTAEHMCANGCLEGQECDDGHMFTTGDKCVFFAFLGKCFCEGQLECVDNTDCEDGDPCTKDWCDENGQCHHDCDIGKSCDDGDPGTIKDECLSSLIEECVCMGTPAECKGDGDCDDGNACTKDSCTADFKCLHSCLEGTMCDDGNPFTTLDKCLWDAVVDKCFCLGKPECTVNKDCDDGNQCTKDSCDKNGSCHHDCTPDLSCSDENPDTAKDKCMFSPLGLCVCEGTAMECKEAIDCDDGNPCTDDWCTDEFKCDHKCLEEAECEDGDQFTLDDKCVYDALSGKCFCHGKPECVNATDCDDGNQCTIDSCDKNGVCHNYCQDGAGCNDGDPETIKDQCKFSATGECVCGGITPGCTKDDDCPAAEEFCLFDTGTCIGPGQCATMPKLCPDVWDPVCGCDGKTYSNSCMAASAGISVDYKGECKTGACWSNDMCANGQYCFFASCAQETGECKAIPGECPDVWDPVCGCDGKTYGNECNAAAAGVSVDYEGECKTGACWSDDMCLKGQYCFYTSCGLKTGECMEMPLVCLDVWDPVCGCDGKTYSNSCMAASAGVSVDYPGQCK